MANCDKIVDANDDTLVASYYGNLTDKEYADGSVVDLGCKRFTFRLTGPRTVTCNNGTWNEDISTESLKCEWTGEYSTEEIIVLAVGISAAALMLIILMGIIVYLIVYGQKREDDDEKRNFDDPSPPPSLVNTNVRKYTQYGDRGPPRYRERNFDDPEPPQYVNSNIKESQYDNREPRRGDLRELGEPRDYVDEPPYRQSNGGLRSTDDGYTFYSGNKQNYSNRAYEPGYDERPPQHGFMDSRTQQVSPDEYARYDWGGRIPRPRLEDYSPPDRRY